MAKENNIGGVLWIVFKDNVFKDKIQEKIAKLYQDNEDIFKGMEFQQIDTVKTMREGKTEFTKFMEK